MSEGSAFISNAGPEGSMPAASASGGGNGQISLYVVRPDETLSEIADMFGVSTNTILWANDIKDPDTIQPGDELLILPVTGIRHVVKSGGTLADVAKIYDADVDEIALYNGIDPDAPLAKGTEIIVPGGDLAPKAVAKKSSGGSTASRALPALTGYFKHPLPSGRITQGVHGYNGIDVGAPSGTPIYAAAAGTVIVAKGGGGYNGGYGNYIVISHANGTQTLYAHMSALAVAGGSVEQGEVIGYVGNTGRSTGFHLHFEVRGAANPLAR